jgi:formylglycine-generating enzyme required for sulfatase activity/DNA-binding CsgD family transcriptional regulator
MTDMNADINRTRAMRIAKQRIEGFAQQFGQEHRNLARHAAFPLVLTPDLLYQIWANFVPEAPWTAVAHVLLSRLCRQVGYEMYEMDIADRNLLLRELKEALGQERFDDLGEFLLDYVAQRLTYDDADTRDLREAQEWTALVYTKPGEAAQELAQALSLRIKNEDMAEVLRLTSLAETLAEPLKQAGFEPLVIYNRGMKNFARGDFEGASTEFNNISKERRYLEISGVTLDILIANIQTYIQKYGLTKREAEIWCLHESNYSDDDIARLLFVTSNTTRKHIKNIQTKIIAYNYEETNTVDIENSAVINEKSDEVSLSEEIESQNAESSTKKIDYTRLYNLLTAENWRKADEETFRLILKATNREKERTLDYKAINNLPCRDLNTIDKLWLNASKRRFGFSVQLKKWQEASGNSNRETEYNFGNNIGWYVNNEWLSDISRFTFNLSAPVGHLPVEWTFHIGGIFPREESVLFTDMASRLLNCNINNLEAKPQFEQSDIEISLQNFEFRTIAVNHKGEIIKAETKQAQYFTENISQNVSLEIVAIPRGTFMMGSPEAEGDDNEHPQHEVTVQPFLMGKYQVTQAQWRVVVNLPKVKCQLRNNPSQFKNDELPVEQVTWDEAVEFCARLSKKTGRQYRLPSEAEWEYACRAGTTTPFYFGEIITSELANYDARITVNDTPSIFNDTKQRQYQQKTMLVGSFPPNSFGLYDMHGNVWEWCADNWHDNYVGAPSNGSVWLSNDTNKLWVLRGGSWNVSARFCRSAFRNWDSLSKNTRNFGFRVVCNVVYYDTETKPQQPIYKVWGEETYGELISDQDNLSSEQGIDYTHLRDLLVAGRLSEADEETLILMLRAAKREETGWLDAESVKNFPCTDLQSIDQLWVKYSNGRFGFSVQKQIWESMGAEPNADDEKWLEFGKRVGWRGSHGAWQEYKNINFSENAHLGHLPLAKLGGGRWTNDKAAQRIIIWGSFIKWVSSLALRLGECGL